MNLLFKKFSKQASIVVASKTSIKLIAPTYHFKLFATSNLFGYIL